MLCAKFVKICQVVLGIQWSFIGTNSTTLYPRMPCAKFGWNWHGNSLKFVNASSLFRFYVSPFDKRHDSHLNKHLEEWFVSRLVKIGPLVQENKIFHICRCNFAVIFPLEKVMAFIWTNLNLLHPRMRCAKFGWNYIGDSEEEVEIV